MEAELPFKILDAIEKYSSEKKLSDSDKSKLIEKARGIYLKSTYDSQEPLGVVAAQSLSEPTTQMSLDYSEKVIIKHQGMITVAPIGEFIDSTMQKIGKENAEGWEVCDVSSHDLYVPSITAQEKIEWNQVKELSRHKSPESLLAIRTLSGRKIVATDSHSFFVRKNNQIIPVSGKDLQAGERLPSIAFLPENCVQEIQTSEIISRQKFIKKPLPKTLELNKELGWIFGAYLAEGNATKFYVSFSNTDPKFLSRIREFADLYGFTYNEYDNNRGFSLGHDIRVNSIQLSELFEKTCQTGSVNKKIPDFAYSAKIDFVAGLLGGYFDGDGNVTVERKQIRASSKSKQLIDGLCLLLSRFGIFARKGESKDGFNMYLPYKYANVFKEKIGLVTYKSEKLDKLCIEYERSKNGYRDEIDMINGFGDILVKISEKLKLPSRYVNSATKRQKIGREALLRHIERFQKVAQEKGIEIKELGLLKQIYDSDVVWDEIISITRVSPTSQNVYDFTVPGTESFTTFDGIVTHNTMRTYHFAGTAGIQVTLGLQRLLEIFDARKEPKTPTMAIYLLSEYQTEEKARQIAERIKESKVKDIIVSDTVNLTDLEIRCKLSLKDMKELDIEAESLPKRIKLRNVDIKVDNNELVATYKKPDIKDIFRLKFKLLESYLTGIKGVSQTVVNRNSKGELMINTLGSDLKKVLKMEGIDTTRTVSNNIFEILDVFGVEAARSAIIDQAMFTIEEQGLGVNIRYVMLLADLMTVDGVIRPIGRYGVVGHKPSTLARAAFEETKKHLTRAAVKGEVDFLNGVIENVMINELVPVGTGAYDLIGRIPEKKSEKE